MIYYKNYYNIKIMQIDFYFWEDKLDRLFLEIIYKTNIRHSEKGRVKGTPLREFRPQNEFPRFSFCFTHPTLGAEEVGNWETPVGADTESSNKSLLSHQRTGKGQSSKTKFLENSCFTLPKDCRKKKKPWSIPYSHQQRPNEEPRILSSQGWNESPQISRWDGIAGMVSKKAEQRAKPFISHQEVMSSPSPPLASTLVP